MMGELRVCRAPGAPELSGMLERLFYSRQAERAGCRHPSSIFLASPARRLPIPVGRFWGTTVRPTERQLSTTPGSPFSQPAESS
jgi:hypothetical protein